MSARQRVAPLQVGSNGDAQSKQYDKKTTCGKVKTQFVSRMPEKIKELPRYQFTTGLCFTAGQLAIFAALISVGIKNNQAVRYVSLKKAPGCEIVQTNVSGWYGLDTGGQWSSSYNFTKTKWLYDLQLTRYRSSVENYRTVYAHGIRDYMNHLNHVFSNRTFGYNLLTLMAVQKNIKDRSATLTFHTDIPTVFQQDSVFGYYGAYGLSTWSGWRSGAPLLASSMPSEGSLNLKDFSALRAEMLKDTIARASRTQKSSRTSRRLTTSSTCSVDASYVLSVLEEPAVTVSGNKMTFKVKDGTALTTAFVKENAFSSGSGMGSSNDNGTSIDLDLRSYVAAVGINTRTIDMKNLTYIKQYSVDVYDSNTGDFTYVSYPELAEYFLDKPNYEGMDPIICNSTSKVCNIVIGYGMMYPTYSSLAELDGYGCECSSSTAHEDICNMLVIYGSLYFYESGCFINHRYKYDYNWDDFNNDKFNMFDFGVANLDNHIINKNYFEVDWLNCRGLLQTNYNNRTEGNYGVEPPTSLIYEYYKCQYTTTTILLNSFSQAFANTRPAAGVLGMLVVMIVAFYIRKVDKMNFFRYDKETIEKTLKAMAIERLMILSPAGAPPPEIVDNPYGQDPITPFANTDGKEPLRNNPR